MNPRVNRLKLHVLVIFALLSSGNSAVAWAVDHVCTDMQCVAGHAATYAAPRAMEYVAPYVSNSLLSSLSWFISPDATPRTIMAFGGLGLGAATILHFKKSPTPSAFLANLSRTFFTVAGTATASYLTAQLPSQWSEYTRHGIVTGVVTAAWASAHAQEIRDVKHTLQSREFHKSIVRTLVLTIGSAVQGTLCREVVDHFVLPKDKAQKKPSPQSLKELPLDCVVCASTPHAKTPGAKTPGVKTPVTSTLGDDKDRRTAGLDDDCGSTEQDDGDLPWKSQPIHSTKQTSSSTQAKQSQKMSGRSGKFTLKNSQETRPQKTSDTPSWTRAASQNVNLAYDATYAWTQTISQHASPAFDTTVVGLWVRLVMSYPPVQEGVAAFQTRFNEFMQPICPWATSSHSDEHDHEHGHHHDEQHDDHANCLHPDHADHTVTLVAERTLVEDGWMDNHMCYPIYHSGR